jgi:hypothetical protein
LSKGSPASATSTIRRAASTLTRASCTRSMPSQTARMCRELRCRLLSVLGVCSGPGRFRPGLLTRQPPLQDSTHTAAARRQ